MEIVSKISMARVIRTPQKSDTEATLTVEVARGARVVVRRGFDGELLRDVVSALGGVL